VTRLLEILDQTRKHDNVARYVLAYFFVNSIDEVNTKDEQASIDFYVSLYWKAPDLVGKLYDDFDTKAAWKPDIEIVGAKDLKPEGDQVMWMNLTASPYGHVGYTQRFRGVIPLPMDLHSFPLDVQTLQITFKSGSWNSNDMILINGTKAKALIDMTKDIDLTEWSVIGDLEVKEDTYLSKHNLMNFSTLVLSLHLRRKVAYYATKIVSILCMLMLMGTVSFVLPPDSLSDRANITFTLFLAAVAFHFVVGDAIPQISYTTSLDKFIFSTYMSLFYIAFESVFVFHIENATYAKYIDKVACAIYLCFFGTVLMTFIGIGIYKTKENTQAFKAVESKA